MNEFLKWFCSEDCNLDFADDELLEKKHDYIQYYFPLNEPSSCNINAPILTTNEISFLQNSRKAQYNLCRNFYRMLEFYFPDCRVEFVDNNEPNIYWAHENFAFGIKWITPNNHNFLRITRILKCLKLFKQDKLAEGFLFFLLNLPQSYKRIVGRESLRYWIKAVYEN